MVNLDRKMKFFKKLYRNENQYMSNQPFNITAKQAKELTDLALLSRTDLVNKKISHSLTLCMQTIKMAATNGDSFCTVVTVTQSCNTFDRDNPMSAQFLKATEMKAVHDAIIKTLKDGGFSVNDAHGPSVDRYKIDVHW